VQHTEYFLSELANSKARLNKKIKGITQRYELIGALLFLERSREREERIKNRNEDKSKNKDKSNDKSKSKSKSKSRSKSNRKDKSKNKNCNKRRRVRRGSAGLEMEDDISLGLLV